MGLGEVDGEVRGEACLGEENGYPRQYSGLENSMDRGAWQAAVQFSSVQSLSHVRLFATP